VSGWETSRPTKFENWWMKCAAKQTKGESDGLEKKKEPITSLWHFGTCGHKCRFGTKFNVPIDFWLGV
jgi:hypothetical protein